MANSGRILIVDDDPQIRRILCRLFRNEYTVAEAGDGLEGLDQIPMFQPDVVLLDLLMPGTDGFETCRRIRLPSNPVQPRVVIVSGQSSRAEQIRAHEMGADDYITKPFDPAALFSRVKLYFRLHQATRDADLVRREIADQHSEFQRIAAERERRIIATQDVAVFTLAKVAESRDNETGMHVVRMRSYAQSLAEYLNLTGGYTDQIDTEFLQNLYRSSPLHDIGKVGIPDEILLKPGRLTPDEYTRMKTHAEIGANILDQAVASCQDAGFLKMAADIARSHHERWDGLGYPDGLTGDAIPLAARIVSVADVFDALTSERPYKEAWSPDRARQLILDERGKQFDPHVVDAFEERYEEFLRIRQLHSDLPEDAVDTYWRAGAPSAVRIGG